MPYTAPTVNYYNTGTASWSTMSGVQSVNISRGRQRFQDPVTQTSMTVELIPTATTTFSVGQFVDVRDTNSDGSVCYFQGQITDVQRSYDFPYNAVSGATPGDRLTVTAAGATGSAGTAQLDNIGWLSTNVGGILQPLLDSQNLQVGTFAVNTIEASSQSFTGALLDAVNQLLNTGQLVLDDYKTARSANKLGYTHYPIGRVYNTIAFTDTGTGYAYSALEYLSSVQNTFNWVEVEATGVSTSITKGTAPFNALKYNTFSYTAADTSNLSAYLYNLLSGQLSPVPFSISTNTNTAPTCMALAQIPEGALANAVIGQPVTVAFRGTSGIGNVIGVNSSFYPDYATVQCYLSPSFGPSFILDSASFGVLDQNRLGL
jgi:hypothetical protein